MYNRQISKCNKCEIEFVYANTILTNISFAEVSLKHIFDCKMIDENMYENKHIYYFFHIQSLLNACGAIINVLRPYGENQYSVRGKNLRRLFDISLSDYKLIFQKEARNTNEHFDERYAELGDELGDYNLLDIYTSQAERKEILNSSHLRTYDIDNKTYYTYINKDNKLQKYSMSLKQLERELQDLKNTILGSEYYREKVNVYFAD